MGHATVNMNGGYGTVVADSSIDKNDVLIQAHDNNSLTIALRGDAVDNVTLTGDLAPFYNSVSSRVGSIHYSDGTSTPIGADYQNYGTPMVSTWTVDTNGSSLVGSNFGSNIFEVGTANSPTSNPAVEVSNIVLGTGVLGGTSGNIMNTILYNGGNAEIDSVTCSPLGSGALAQLRTGVEAGWQNMWFIHNGNDLTIDVIGPQNAASGSNPASPEKLTFKDWYISNINLEVTSIYSGDGYITLTNSTAFTNLLQTMSDYSADNVGFNPLTETSMPANINLQTGLVATWSH